MGVLPFISTVGVQPLQLVNGHAEAAGEINPDSRGRVTEVWIVQPPHFLRDESIDPAPRQCCDVIRL